MTYKSGDIFTKKKINILFYNAVTSLTVIRPVIAKYSTLQNYKWVKVTRHSGNCWRSL